MESIRESEELNEIDHRLGVTGKLLLASIGAWFVGKVVNTKLRGSKAEITAITNALLASKRFQEELRRPGASVQSVVDRLHVKRMTAEEFERLFGIRWPL
jgi:hypothetical protein